MRLLLLSLFTLVLFGCDKPPAIELPPPKVGVVDVLQTEIATQFEFPGRTVAPQRVEIRPQVEGTIHKRFFTDGQRVQRGQELFQIDARSPEAALAQAKADLARAQVNAADAAKIAATNKTLLDQGVLGREEYQQSKADADAAQALVKASQAIVQSAALTRGFATIVAPFDGRISEAEVDVGSFVAPGSARLAVLARLDPMYADFTLSEREFLRLPMNQERRQAILDGKTEAADAEGGNDLDAVNDRLLVALELADGSIHPYQGVLNLVSIEIDEDTGTYPMRAVFPNADNLLIPGLFAQIIIRTRDKHDAVLVPQQAFVLKQVGIVVYVVGEGGKLEQRRVKLGQRVGELTEVTEGLEAGETVVTEGVHKCRDGLVIAPEPKEPLSLESDPLAQEPKPGPDGWFERFQAERRTATLVGG